MVAELLGWFGAGLSCVISLPQVVRTMRAKRLDGISSATYWLVLVNAAAWTAWSLLTGEYAAGVPALVNGPAAIVILHRLVASRHTAGRSEFDTEVRESPPVRFTDVAAIAPSIRAAAPPSQRPVVGRLASRAVHGVGPIVGWPALRQVWCAEGGRS